jgi:Homing endonuclease associated repeat
VRKPVSKDEVIAAIRECARKLGRPPSLAEFERLSGISFGKLRRHFEGIGDATRAAGLEPNPRNLRTGTRALLTDWARVARKVRRLPSRDDYRRYGQHSAKSLFVRFGRWALLPVHFLDFARNSGIEDEWQDVLGMIAHKLRLARTEQDPVAGEAPSATPGSANIEEAGNANVAGGHATRLSFAPSHPLLTGRPLAGGPLSLPGLSHEPANEAGVIFLFGILAHRLGFRVISLQPAFPDCEAMRELQPGKWQRVRVEFEFESRNFKDHGHDPDLCDVIVCWRHNWAECPPQIDVVELSRMVQ